MSVMATGVRFPLKLGYLKYIHCRSFYTSAIKMEEAIEKLQKNPYYEKYANRIAQLQRTSPEEFMTRMESAHCSTETEDRTKLASLPDTRQYSSVLNPKRPLSKEMSVEEKNLDSIFKTNLVKNKDSTEIQTIWEEYHKGKEVISATIPLKLYEMITDNMHQFPMFVFPLPRSQGYEFILSQVCGHTVHFTPLLAFQVHKENAPECLTMVHYTELTEKGIILMRGEYDKNVLSGKEAQCLANQFQMYYNNKDCVKSQLLQTFTKNPDSFKHVDLIKELENISII